MVTERDPHMTEKLNKEIKRIEADTLSAINRDALKSAIVWKPGFEPVEEKAMIPLPASVEMKDPAYLHRFVDELAWESFCQYIPAGKEYEKAIRSLCVRLQDDKLEVADAVKLALALKDMTREIIKGILQVKAKQSEKPVQNNTMIKVDRGGLGINDTPSSKADGIRNGTAKRGRSWTPEQRASQSEKLKERLKAKRDAKAATAADLSAQKTSDVAIPHDPVPANSIPSAQAAPSS